ncbi:MAG TPA: ATP-binding cassette domain-containing protein [Terriglobales bacterium]|nr:ATP-binding cassette domain-containing protein [Terriglobales bacterium]
MSLQPAASSAAPAHVLFEDVHMAFGGRTVLRGMSCEFPRGRISIILGGSGAGKTTILRLIGGLVRPQKGRIAVAGLDVTSASEADLYTVRDKLGMMFQGGALLDSLSIFDNLAFPLREHSKLSEAEIAKEVRDKLAAVGMSGVDHLLPGQLSGGMVKRAALARAIINRPEILLCDEPFSGLDPISVKRIEALLRHINRELDITILISSHHVPSTLRLADQVVLLVQGQAMVGSAQSLRTSPDPMIAEFLNEEVDHSRALDLGFEPERRPIL